MLRRQSRGQHSTCFGKKVFKKTASCTGTLKLFSLMNTYHIVITADFLSTHEWENKYQHHISCPFFKTLLPCRLTFWIVVWNVLCKSELDYHRDFNVFHFVLTKTAVFQFQHVIVQIFHYPFIIVFSVWSTYVTRWL